MKKILYILAIVLIIAIISYFTLHQMKPANQSLQSKQIDESEQPIIFIIIDSLMDEPLQKAMQEGRAPALKFLQKNGHYYDQMVSSYPTMSISIESTILTGKYSDQHHIPGLVWFDVDQKQMINYGSAKGETWNTGLKKVLENTLYHLNHTHLNKNLPTLHETLSKQGLQSGSINPLIYRGPVKTKLKIPTLIEKMNVRPVDGIVRAPDLFSYGMFAQFSEENNKNTYPWQRFGFNDSFTTLELVEILRKRKLPDFTFAYFPELDQQVHKKGPNQSIQEIEKVDKQLQEVLNTYSSWEGALEHAVWIVLGDSGQSKVKKDKEQALIHLNERFKDYQLYDVKKEAREDDQIAIAYNERMAFIYRLDDKVATEEVVEILLAEERLALIAWKNGKGDAFVKSPGNKSKLSFRPDGNINDIYGQKWDIAGDHSILDFQVTDGKIVYGNYPDGLARLYSALYSHAGDYLIVDAKPGFELAGEGTPTHVGGASHGSLHKKDAMVPMIVTGTDIKPTHFRLVDLHDWFLKILDKAQKA